MAEQTARLAPVSGTRETLRVQASGTRRSRPAAARRRRGYLAVLPITAFLALALVAPLVLTTNPTVQDLTGRLQYPVWLGGTWSHPLGTDGLGRDLLARIAAGARSSLVISVIAATGAAVIGVVAGLIAGIRGGLADRVITMLVETLLAVPFITFGIVVTATVGQSVANVLFLLVFTGWITHARIVRLQTRSLMQAEFIAAASALGAGRFHIAFVHLLPNLAPVIIVVLFQQAGAMMLWSASLTYLGIGLPVEQITLGGIVRDGQELIYTAWWVSVMGGLAIALAVTGFNLFADWLQRRIDPTLR
jgi:peptide/nickel transport system permease protein